MERTVKTTRIEKTYKDKVTGEKKKVVIDYAKVADRIKEFRQDCPNGDIDTIVTLTGTKVLVKAVIIKDRSKNDSSARGTGHSVGDSQTEKGIEKTETLAVGRALAMLGYGASGEIASAEEMEEFLEHQQEKHREYVLELRGLLEDAKDLKELARIWSDIPMSKAKQEVEPYKNELKVKLTTNTTDHEGA